MRCTFRGYVNLVVIINDVARKWSGLERTVRGRSQTITTVDYFIATLHTRTYIRTCELFSRNCSTTHVLHARNLAHFFPSTISSLFLNLPIFISLTFSRSFCRLRLCTSGIFSLAYIFDINISVLALLINALATVLSTPF